MILPSGHTARRTNLGLQCLCSSLGHNTVLLLFLPKYFTVAVFSQNKESTKFRCNGRGLKLGSLTSTGALAVLLIGFVLTIANIRSGSTLSWTKQLLSCSVLELKIFFSYSFNSLFCYWLSSLSHYKQQWQWWYVIYYPYHYGSHLHTYIIDSYLHSYYVHQAFISTPYQRCTRYISVSYLLHTNVVGTSSNHIYTLPT